MRTGAAELISHARKHPGCGHPPERVRRWTVDGQQVEACTACAQLLEGTWQLRPGRTYEESLGIEEA